MADSGLGKPTAITALAFESNVMGIGNGNYQL
jgi:hypothetical protein